MIVNEIQFGTNGKVVFQNGKLRIQYGTAPAWTDYITIDSAGLISLPTATAVASGLSIGGAVLYGAAGAFHSSVQNNYFDWLIGEGTQTTYIILASGLTLHPTAGSVVQVDAAPIQLAEITAPGAGAADMVRIYAVVGGDTLTDLAAVFQDGTVDIFAQEVTPISSPIFTHPSRTQLGWEVRKPHPGLKQFGVVFPNGEFFVLRQIEHHDTDLIAADTGSEGPLPAGWFQETATERAQRIAAAKAQEGV